MSCSFFPATLYHTSLPPFIFSMGHGRGPFSLLKNPLFVKNKEEAKANNKVRQSPFCQQSLTCYLECYQYWGGIRCRWERRTGRQTLLLLLLRLLCEGWKKKADWHISACSQRPFGCSSYQRKEASGRRTPLLDCYTGSRDSEGNAPEHTHIFNTHTCNLETCA